MTITAKVVADSLAARNGKRLTTIQVRYPRVGHSEVMTHRVFSRNASSSRAIPIETIIQEVITDPYVPLFWGKNRPGMQATEEMDPEEAAVARAQWLEARNAAVRSARELSELGLHKQDVNRLLEPFAHISVIISSTEWGNFYNLRRDAAAYPVLHALGDAVYAAHAASTPLIVCTGEWHLPYVTQEERHAYDLDTLKKVSVARCARVSYNNHDGTTPSIYKDVMLHDRLRASLHMSAFEHQATPLSRSDSRGGNFLGWQQYRQEVPGENRPEYPSI